MIGTLSNHTAIFFNKEFFVIATLRSSDNSSQLLTYQQAPYRSCTKRLLWRRIVNSPLRIYRNNNTSFLLALSVLLILHIYNIAI